MPSTVPCATASPTARQSVEAEFGISDVADAADRLAGLRDRPRPGRPRMFSAVQVAQVKALACEPPGRQNLPLARWSAAEPATEELATAAARQQIVASVSASTIRRWLAQDALKPWRYRLWIFPRDPDFTIKAARVLDLYARRWAGRRLRPDEYVLSADEKTGVQALRRIHPGLAAGSGRPARVEFEYRRRPSGDWTAVCSFLSHTSGQPNASRQNMPTFRLPSQVTSPR